MLAIVVAFALETKACLVNNAHRGLSISRTIHLSHIVWQSWARGHNEASNLIQGQFDSSLCLCVNRGKQKLIMENMRKAMLECPKCSSIKFFLFMSLIIFVPNEINFMKGLKQNFTYKTEIWIERCCCIE